MARKRMIDPSFWEDEKLGSVGPIVRLLFMGLISQADDDGRLKGHPSLLRSVIFPYDDQVSVADVDDWLNLLAADERKVIRRYEVDHQKYIHITNFKKHQTINKPQKSKLPEPPNYYGSNTVEVQESYYTDTAQNKLIEVKGSEEESKLSESPAHSTFNDPIKDRIYQFAVKCEIKNVNIITAEQELFFFIDKMDIEVIESALTKSVKNHIRYAAKILTDWMNEGKTKKEQLRTSTPQRGYTRDTLKTGKPILEVVKDDGPIREITPEEREQAREIARRMKGETA